MALKAGVVAMVGLFLLLVGIRPDGLPFIPQAAFSDAVIAHWPNALYLRRSVLEEGTFPLWRDTIMAGQPFAANPLNKTAYPLQWLVLFLPPALHLNLMIVLHLVLAGWGMWRWARTLGLREEAALLSALAYMLAPKSIAHLGAGHLDILYALAWWPWLMWSIASAQLEPNQAVKSALRTAWFAAILFLADVRLSIFALLTAAVYELWLLDRSKAWRRSGWHLLMVMPFFLMTASVLVPFVFWQPYLSRAGLTPHDASVFALEWPHFIRLLMPATNISVERFIYLGLPTLLLAGIGITTRAKSQRALWLALVTLVSLYALGENGPLWPVMVRTIPALLWFRVPSRIWFILVLLAPLLAGYGLQALMDFGQRIREEPLAAYRIARLRLITASGMAGMLACGLFSLAALPISGTARLGMCLVAGILGAVLLLVLTKRLTPRQVALGLLGLTFFDLAWSAHLWLAWRGPEFWLEPYRALAERLAEKQPDRLYSPTYSIPQQAAEAYQLRLFGGVDPFQLRGVIEGIAQGSGVGWAGYEPMLPPPVGMTGDDLTTANRDARPDTKVLATWGVSHVVAAYPIQHERLRWIDTVDGHYVYVNLDYTLQSGTPWGWPPDWPGLPRRGVVQHLHLITFLAALVSGVSFILYSGILLWGVIRRVLTSTKDLSAQKLIEVA